MPTAFGSNSVGSALGSGAKRDRSTADRRYYGRPFRPLKTGTFYIARNRNSLLCLDSADSASRRIRIGAVYEPVSIDIGEDIT